MIKQLIAITEKPELFKESSAKFWDDEHISEGMLEAHLNPTWDAATRNHSFVDESVNFIADIASPSKYSKLLDLGCGPGIYAEKFYNKGYDVTGIDLSKRSIQYAMKSAKENKMTISYIIQNYLTIEYSESFDLVTLIYCDFGVLSAKNRKVLLEKIYQSLKPGGKLIFDMFTPNQFLDRPESRDWNCFQKGFWKDTPHLCLDSFYRYDDDSTYLDQTIVITDNQMEVYNNWDHAFTPEEIKKDLSDAGFTKSSLFSNIAGEKYIQDSHTICIVTEK